MRQGAGSRAHRAPDRVLVVVGTRPEAIKMAPVVRALGGLAPGVESRLVLTGQHRELVDDALAGFHMTPHWELGVMRPDQSVYDVVQGCLEGLRRVVEGWSPHLILVQGDTATVFTGALVGYLQGVAVGHVEAGLRTGDLRKPFPEEGFRRMAGVLADLHFAPTDRARQNLLREGVPGERVHVTGNTVVDALLAITSGNPAPRNGALARLLGKRSPEGAGPRSFILLTAHRRESFGEPLERVFQGVLELVETHPAVEVLFPVHPNPHVREPAERILGAHPRIHLVSPLGYGDLALALRGAALVLTDSGGIQEEAPTFGTPVLVLREVTERPEGVEAGVARLVGTDPERLLDEAARILAEGAGDGNSGVRENPYGDGRAGERIAELVRSFLEERDR